MFLLSGCSSGNKPNYSNDQRYQIYKQAVAGGYQGTYEEWLETIKGKDGKDGKDGATVLTGNRVPSNDLGKDNDCYIDLENWNFYVKVNNAWILKGNIKGADGLSVAGENGLSAYEIYIKYHPGYTGDEEQWINDLISGKLLGGNAPIVGSFTFGLNADGNSYLISDYNGSDKCIVIPETYNGYPVTRIGENVFADLTIESVVLTKNLRQIDSKAFYNCSTLLDVYFKGGIEDWLKISFADADSCPVLNGEHVFFYDENNNYKAVDEIIVPEGTTSIGNYQFKSFKPNKIVIPNSVKTIGEYAFADATYNVSELHLDCEDDLAIGKYAFDFSTGYKSIVTNIYFYGSFANWCEIDFYNAMSSPMALELTDFYYLNDDEWVRLEEIVIPDTITAIGKYQFYNFWMLRKITIPSSVSDVDNQAFTNCYKLVEVYNFSGYEFNFGDNKLKIHTTQEESIIKREGDYLFADFDDGVYLLEYLGSLKEITLPKTYNGVSYSYIYQYAFIGLNSSFDKIILDTNFTSVDSSAFCNADVEEVVLANTITSIGASAFKNSSVSKINLENVTSLSESSFAHCEKITTVTLSEDLGSIPTYCFSQCKNLNSVYGFNGTYIGKSAFYGCSSLLYFEFENCNTANWYVSTYATFSNRASVTVTSPDSNAFYLRDLYCSYYWKVI